MVVGCLGLLPAAGCGSSEPANGNPGAAGSSGTPAAAGTSSADAAGASDEGQGGRGAISSGGAAGSSSVGGLDLIGIAGEGQGGGASDDASCELGEVSSTGTNQNLDLFGNVVYFADGIELPSGRYRIKYVDGCMKYSSAQDWAVHAYPGAEPDGWWFVGEDQTHKIVVPPGSVGFLVSNGGFATFEECVAANRALPPSEFEFSGGKLGVWLQDSPYSDNLAGLDERNPKWMLTLLGDCDRIERPE